MTDDGSVSIQPSPDPHPASLTALGFSIPLQSYFASPCDKILSSIRIQSVLTPFAVEGFVQYAG